MTVILFLSSGESVNTHTKRGLVQVKMENPRYIFTTALFFLYIFCTTQIHHKCPSKSCLLRFQFKVFFIYFLPLKNNYRLYDCFVLLSIIDFFFCHYLLNRNGLLLIDVCFFSHNNLIIVIVYSYEPSSFFPLPHNLMTFFFSFNIL